MQRSCQKVGIQKTASDLDNVGGRLLRVKNAYLEFEEAKLTPSATSLLVAADVELTLAIEEIVE